MTDTIILKVDGMSCDGCVKAVERAIKTVAATAVTTIDLAIGAVKVSQSGASVAALSAAIEKAGYDVVA